MADPVPSAWGRNNFGQAGVGQSDTNLHEPTPLALEPPPGVLVSDAVPGWAWLFDDGTVWAAGRNNRGQLGQGSTAEPVGSGDANGNNSTPLQVTDPSDPSGFLQDVIQIAPTTTVLFALKSDGTLWGWGQDNGSRGLWGNGTRGGAAKTVPFQIPDAGDMSGKLTDVIQIATGGGFVLALKSNGDLYAWGDNLYGQLANGVDWLADDANPARYTTAPTLTLITAPTPMSGDPQCVEIAAGAETGYARYDDGSVWAWGNNTSAQCGTLPVLVPYSGNPPDCNSFTIRHWTVTAQSTPAKVPDPDTMSGFIEDAVGVRAASSTAWALFETVDPEPDDPPQYAKGWGLNTQYQALGEAGGTGGDNPLSADGCAVHEGFIEALVAPPASSSALSDTLDIHGDALTTLMRRADFSVYSWGTPSDGALGRNVAFSIVPELPGLVAAETDPNTVIRGSGDAGFLGLVQGGPMQVHVLLG